MKYIFCIALMVLECCKALAQADSLIVQNSVPVNAGRYRDIDGSPYYFREWVKGSVLRSDGKTVENVTLNYNGYSHEMEVQSGNAIYSLDKSWHLRMDIYADQNPNVSDQFPAAHLIFMRGVHRDLANRYATILFLGERMTLIRDCDIGKVEKEFNDVGKTIFIKRFKDLSIYYLKKGNILIQLKLHKKRVAEAFDNDMRIVDFVSAENLDMNDEADLIRLVKFADALE